MLDFKNYSYSDTLKMLDGWYDHDTENVNYTHVLLSMNGCNTINDCIKVYKRVYEKYQKYMNSTSQSGHESFDEAPFFIARIFAEQPVEHRALWAASSKAL